MTKLLRYIRLPTTKNVIINTFGNYFGFFVAGFYTIFLVRFFTPEEFGVLSVLLVMSYLLANILSFGMPASIYANVPILLPDKVKAMEFIKTNFIFLTILSFGSLMILYAFVNQIDTYLLKINAPKEYYLLAFAGTALYIWQNYIRDVLNSAQHFLQINIAINVANVIKVGILVFIAFQGTLTIANTLITLGIIGPIITILIVILERKWIVTSFHRVKFDRSTIKVGYTLTYFLSTQLFNLATRADLFMVAFFLSATEVGYYSLSQRIIVAIVASADSITQVLSPQFAKIKTRKETIRLLKHSFVYMLIPSAIFASAILTPSFVYDLVFTREYMSSTIITKLLSFSYILFPFTAAAVLFFLYTIKKPMYLLISNGLMLVVLVVGNLIFIPMYGRFGPAISYFVAFVSVYLFVGYFFIKEFRRLKA